jgi:hypothetical protein
MAHPACEVRFTRALPARHLPSAGFGYPLDGLLPRAPCRPFFVPAAPVGFSLRSVLLDRGCPALPPSLAPLAVTANPTLMTEAIRARIVDRLPGTTSNESLRATRVFSPTGGGGSLGVSPSQGTAASILSPRFRGPPPTRLFAGPIAQPGFAAPRSLDRSTPRPTTGAGHPSQGFRTSSDPGIRPRHAPGPMN